MNKQLNRSDYREPYSLGSLVEFDGPYNSGRLRGEVVRVSSNPGYLHVEVDGTRYEVFILADNAHMIWED